MLKPLHIKLRNGDEVTDTVLLGRHGPTIDDRSDPYTTTFLIVTKLGHFYRLTMGDGVETVQEVWTEQDGN